VGRSAAQPQSICVWDGAQAPPRGARRAS
jgi:hypothetical protein